MRDDRYGMFRNFMVNELGISKDDILQWTYQAVDAFIERMVSSGKINLQVAVNQAVDRAVRSILEFDSSFKREKLEEKVLKMAADKIEVKLK